MRSASGRRLECDPGLPDLLARALVLADKVGDDLLGLGSWHLLQPALVLLFELCLTTFRLCKPIAGLLLLAGDRRQTVPYRTTANALFPLVIGEQPARRLVGVPGTPPLPHKTLHGGAKAQIID